MNTDAWSAELAQAPVLHGGSARENGHRSALRGTSGDAQCPAGRSQVIKPKPEELPACLAVCGWRGFTPRCDAALRVVGVGSLTLRCRASCCRRGFAYAAMLPTLCSTRAFDANEASGCSFDVNEATRVDTPL
jgi:hypothetical protein